MRRLRHLMAMRAVRRKGQRDGEKVHVQRGLEAVESRVARLLADYRAADAAVDRRR